MKEINDEIKLTLNLMQIDIDDGAHGELQNHLHSLLEIKRNELQQRLVERSWLDHADGIDKAKPLTAEELKAGGWWCADTSEKCRSVFAEKCLKLWSDTWSIKGDYEYCYLSGDIIVRVRLDGALAFKAILKQIHRIGNDFYWCE